MSHNKWCFGIIFIATNTSSIISMTLTYTEYKTESFFEMRMPTKLATSRSAQIILGNILEFGAVVLYTILTQNTVNVINSHSNIISISLVYFIHFYGYIFCQITFACLLCPLCILHTETRINIFCKL